MPLLLRFHYFLRSIVVMLGKKPDGKPKPESCSEAAAKMHAFQKTPEEVKKRRKAIEDEKFLTPSRKWKIRRWIVLIAVNSLFMISWRYDVQLVEGALTGARVLGFHFADLNSSLQVMLAYKTILVNLVIGTTTVLVMWWTFGGRTFCAWVCPYHFLAEIAEMLHLKFSAKGLAKDYVAHRGVRTVLYIVFLALAFITGYTVYETISPTGIVSRALIYGGTLAGSLALWWVAFLLLFEVFVSRRFWCRYVCPIGLTYGFVGATSPVGITYNLEKCLHEGECLDVCMVPHVLQCTKIGHAQDVEVNIGPDCTRCGMCVDVCPTDSLRFNIRYLDDVL